MRRFLFPVALAVGLLTHVPSFGASGTAFLLEIGPRPDGQTVGTEEAIKAFEKRLNRLGSRRHQVSAKGSNLVEVRFHEELADRKGPLLRRLTNSVTLEFRLVHPQSQELLAQGIVPPSHEKLSESWVMRDGSTKTVHFLVEKQSVGGLSERHIARAFPEPGLLDQQPQISFELTPEGRRLFAQATTEGVGRQLAIILSGQLMAAPVIHMPITGGLGQISGSFTLAEAGELAAALDAPLGFPVTLLKEHALETTETATFERRGYLKLALVALAGLGGLLIIAGVAVLIFRRLT